jgi:hypothetical protein
MISMKNFIPTVNNYTFHICFIDPFDETFVMEVTFSTSAPHYEAAVAQALAHGQQFLRDAKEQCDRNLFMRVCKA